MFTIVLQNQPIVSMSMLQYSKVLKSRDEWKKKANQRADENREHRKARKRHLETIAELKANIHLMEQALDAKKNH